jgi:hypothetical protein
METQLITERETLTTGAKAQGNAEWASEENGNATWSTNRDSGRVHSWSWDVDKDRENDGGGKGLE